MDFSSSGRAVWLALAFLLSVGCDSCEDEIVTPARTAPPEPLIAAHPTPDLRLLFFTDLGGHIEPCGCSEGQLGGIDHAAAIARDLQPAALFLAGDSLSSPGAHVGPSAHAQDAMKQRLLVEVLGQMGARAGQLGPADLDNADLIEEDARAAGGFPWLLPGQRERMVLQTSEGAQRSLRVTAIHHEPSTPPSTAPSDTADVTDAAEAAEPPDEDADLEIALFAGTMQEARRVAELGQFDFVIVGGEHAREPQPPQRVGATWLLRGGSQGQRLLVLDLYLAPGDAASGFSNASAWSADEERMEIYAAIQEIEERLEEWRAGDFDPAQIQAQEARLAGLQRELEAVQVPALERPAFAAWAQDVDPEVEAESRARRAIDRYDLEVNAHNRVAFVGHMPPEVGPGERSYVGSQTCQSCHNQAYSWWNSHPHGNAYETLVERHKEYHLDCVGCHVTGYERPGGSTVTHNIEVDLQNVGCEQCHGPGSAHIASRAAADITREVPERVCAECHNEEHSPRFVYEAFRRTLLVPGHGAPGGAPGGAPAP